MCRGVVYRKDEHRQKKPRIVGWGGQETRQLFVTSNDLKLAILTRGATWRRRSQCSVSSRVGKLFTTTAFIRRPLSLTAETGYVRSIEVRA